MDIMAAGYYKSNAELIEAARDLGYLDEGMSILDPTYGYGTFWKNWRPPGLIGMDLHPEKAPDGVADFTRLPFRNDTFDAVVFDPPYKLNGTPTQDEIDERYGVNVPAAWQDRMELCVRGIWNARRVTKPGGFFMVKCMDQVCSGKKVWQTRAFADYGEGPTRVHARLVDQLHILSTPRPQPPGRRQVHSRQNYSTLLVFRKKG